MTMTLAQMKSQIAGETKARVAAEARLAAVETQAEAAERSERALTGEVRRLRARVADLEAVAKSNGVLA